MIRSHGPAEVRVLICPPTAEQLRAFARFIAPILIDAELAALAATAQMAEQRPEVCRESERMPTYNAG